MTATPAAAITAPAIAPTATPRTAPSRRRPSAEPPRRRARAPTSETATRAAPATTNCQLPPGSTALEPTSGWRRLPQRMRNAANSQIFTGPQRGVLVDGESGDDGGEKG